jgi:branched-chain amino acid transport system permease protein
MSRRWVLVGVAAGIVLTIVATLVADIYWRGWLATALIVVLLAVSWNLMGGVAGLFSLGHAAFFGIGAYVAAGMLTVVGPSPLGLLVALACAAVAAALAVVVILPVFRTRGLYFGIVTMAFAALCLQLGNRILPGGRSGVFIDRVFPVDNVLALVVVAVAVIAAAVVSFVVRHSTFGLSLIAMRDDPQAAESVGVDIRRAQLRVSLMSAAIAGIAGALYTATQGFIDPDTVFSLTLSVQPVLMTILGGVGTVTGPIIGGGLWSVVDETLRGLTSLSGVSVLVYGLVLTLLALAMPTGLIGVVKAVWSRIPTRFHRATEEES